jgi:hypothetical protein
VPGVEGLERLVEVQGRRRCECERWHRSGRQRAGGGRARVGSCSRTGGDELREGWVFTHVAGCGHVVRGVGCCSRSVRLRRVGLCSRWWRAGSPAVAPVGPVRRAWRALSPPAALVLVYEAICAGGAASRLQCCGVGLCSRCRPVLRVGSCSRCCGVGWGGAVLMVWGRKVGAFAQWGSAHAGVGFCSRWAWRGAGAVRWRVYVRGQ